jgi:hypothetical protein
MAGGFLESPEKSEFALDEKLRDYGLALATLNVRENCPTPP